MPIPKIMYGRDMNVDFPLLPTRVHCVLSNLALLHIQEKAMRSIPSTGMLKTTYGLQELTESSDYLTIPLQTGICTLRCQRHCRTTECVQSMKIWTIIFGLRQMQESIDSTSSGEILIFSMWLTSKEDTTQIGSTPLLRMKIIFG